MSLCTRWKGHLKSRFLVLSDDRQPPPPPNRKRRFDDEDQVNQQGKRFHNVDSRASNQPQTNTRQLQVTQPPVTQQQIVSQSQVSQSSHSRAPAAVPNQGYFSQVVQTLANPAIFSPTSFPPLPAIPALPQTKPLLHQPRLIVQGDGYQTVTNRHSWRLSKKVA